VNLVKIGEIVVDEMIEGFGRTHQGRVP
jgi:hypothetical protein